MRRLIVFLIFLVLAVVTGLEIARHPGYLLITYHAWVVQMPLWFAAVSLITLFTLFYILIDSIDRLQFMWYRFKNWLRIRSEHKAYSKTQHGLSLIVEGRWKKAEKLLVAGVNQSFEPLMNYLGAARAAQEQNEIERRDQYIKKAYEVAPNAELAIGITQAELEIEQNQYEHAAATLNHLRQLSPRHPRVLKLLEKVYVHLADWKQLRELLPLMQKTKILNAEQTSLFEKNIYSEIFNASNNKSLDELHALWNKTPRALRKNPDVVFAYVKQLLRVNETSEAEELIRKTIKQYWQPDLVTLYGTLPFTNLNRQLVIVGAWLNSYGPKPEILLTLGRLCVRVQLWGKAKDYFEKCLAQGPNGDASLEYGKLLEKLGQPQDALQKYRQGLAEDGVA